MEVEDAEKSSPESDAAATAAAAGGAASASASAATGLPLPTADFRGQYELFSIVTHKGRSANGGHYIGWAKKAKFSDSWYKFDDDTVRLSLLLLVSSTCHATARVHITETSLCRPTHMLPRT